MTGRYTRFCKHCENYFKTDTKFSRVCPDCKEKIKEQHLYRTNGHVLIV